MSNTQSTTPETYIEPNIDTWISKIKPNLRISGTDIEQIVNISNILHNSISPRKNSSAEKLDSESESSSRRGSI